MSKQTLPFHVLVLSWIVVMLLLARYRPESYVGLLQEDGPIEWATVWLFGAAGIIQLRRAIRHRLFFDLLIAVFCLIVAGEEFSWGQRLLGYASPQYFLTHNYQQEVNFHNLPGSIVKPRWFLIAALAGYGIGLPLMSRSTKLSAIMKRIGTTAPPVQLTIWFALCIALLLWYPFTLTGEWVEALAGGLFVASMTLHSGTPWIVLSLSLIFGVVMTEVMNRIEPQRNPNLTYSVNKCLSRDTRSFILALPSLCSKAPRRKHHEQFANPSASDSSVGACFHYSLCFCRDGQRADSLSGPGRA